MNQATSSPTLYLAFELGQKQWRLGFIVGLGQPPRERTIPAGNLTALQREIALARKRFGLPEDARVLSCYEAGPDGFWLHRYLTAHGVENYVVDSASIEVNRRARRAKTDHLDVGKLVTMLIRFDAGDQRVWSVVHVPDPQVEDRRHLHRQLATLKADRTRHRNRIQGLLVGQGVRLPVKGDFLEQLASVRLWDGSPLPEGLRTRLEQEYAALQFTEEQIRTLEAQRRQIIRTSDDPLIQQVRRLMALRAIGENIAWVLVMELFGWRDFRNRRQVGGLSGLAPVPHQSGEEEREQGISKASQALIRAIAVELAWCWLRYQPESALSQWYWQRFGNGSKRQRKIGIVALARKLLIALWRYLTFGEVPAGARMKA
jgi:transposase